MAPSCLFWKISYACGAWSSGNLWVAKSSTPSGSEGAMRSGMMVSVDALTLAGAMRAWAGGQVVGGEVLHTKGVGGVDEERHDGVGPRLDVGLAHADLDLLVEELQHVDRVGRPAVDAAYGERAATAYG